ncbi:MAG: hypothetical protein MZV63_71060 [Marinilabiliales bacterium]|nr:hypothetical protein [Marinilabiliales bacterium]
MSCEEYLKTKAFTEKKEYLLDKRRFEKTDMFKELKEYEQPEKLCRHQVVFQR